MKAVIFLGPSLPVEEASRRFPAVYLPPAAQGDVLRAARERPLAIGIVDGNFDGVPSIWHKEILWALTQGIHVFGASSMGALRAAELAAFGMKGVGKVFEAFQAGALEDDDEVAVVHAEAGAGYRPMSEAMVNIRATLERAERAGIAGAGTCKELVAIAKASFYPDRSYPRLLAEGLERGLALGEIDALRAFLETGRVDRKREDALALLAAVDSCCQAGARPEPAGFRFSNTEAWSNLVAWVESQPDRASADAALVAAEARLSGSDARGLFAAALSRAAAVAIARRLGRKERGQEGAAVDQPTGDWLQAQGLSAEGHREYLKRGADLEWLRRHLRNDLSMYVVDELRARGEYAALAQRALKKRELLASRGFSEPKPTDVGMEEHDVMAWYFRRLGRPVPSDMAAFFAESGISDMASLRQEALRELLFDNLNTQPTKE
jgi:hypothetical protein